MTDTEIVRACGEAMGWTWGEAGSFSSYRDAWVDADGEEVAHPGWNPLTSDTDFMACINKMADKRYSIAITYENGEWIVAFQKEDEFRSVEGGTDPRRAVCIAILKAKGLWREEQ